MVVHGRGQRLGGLAPHRAVAIGQQVQHLVAGEVLAVDGKAQARDGLVEQSGPGRPAGDRLLVQQLLDLVGQLVRPEGAQVAQPRRIVGERGRLQLLRQAVVGEPVELEGEEQQVGRDDVDLLLHRLEELADRRIGHVAGVDQLGITQDAAEPLLLALVIGDGGA
jgi:hypothetical protein